MIQIRGWSRNILLLVGTIFFIFLIWYFRNIVTYILLAVVLSFLGRPFMQWLSLVQVKGFKIPSGIAALLTLVILWSVIISFFSFIIPLVVREIEVLSQIDFETVFHSFEEPLSKILKLSGKDPVFIHDKSLTDIVAEELGEKINFSQISNIFTFIASVIGEILLGIFAVSFITFFFLKDKNMFKEAIILLVPTEFESRVVKVLDSSSYLLRRYFIGIILEMFMVMLLVTTGLTLVGLTFSHGLLIGLLCGLFNVIPYLGPWMGALLGLIIGAALNINTDFMNHTLPMLGLMTVIFIIVQLIDNIVFQPVIYSSSVKAHPLEIFLVIIAAGSIAGITGMLLAIPAYTIIRVIAREFLENMKLVKKLTENLNEQKQVSKKQKSATLSSTN
ncbi:MAG TPA: AI-2E family transporter [Mariniphaga sp.]|nr:AI-2E family transporter [Mariniphaga sp.]